MHRFFSTKNTFTLIILWAVVLFFITTIVLNYVIGNIPLIPLYIVSIVTGFMVWVIFDTRYVIKNDNLYYRSGPIRGRIDIKKITSLKKYSGLNVPVLLKPALDTKGFIITYNKYDDVFISPKKSEQFIEELMKINPNIKII
ncbi:PH domain-containing protein [Flavobacterium aciduliphilum]|uniref:PH (Pleckstrin Homology) domain-containing protein n=1 Tax=Flavobacterium aciduliphilum TaxID=1101402 RepID=A0A328YBR9_9FLAO|nr:PH domain-containing protein [Flavobacterium aciduliphilum]RAR70654.1 PH (Pleckstrin Homology) domain-containing protein [Flavobacterium aciduliphilum]